MIIRNIVRLSTEPDINSLWLKGDSLFQYNNGEWKDVSGEAVQATTEALERIDDLTNRMSSLTREVYGVWDDVQSIKEVIAAMQSNELPTLLKKLNYTDEDIEVFKHMYITYGIDITLSDIKQAVEMWENRGTFIREALKNRGDLRGALRFIKILPKVTEKSIILYSDPEAVNGNTSLSYDEFLTLFYSSPNYKDIINIIYSPYIFYNKFVGNSSIPRNVGTLILLNLTSGTTTINVKSVHSLTVTGSTIVQFDSSTLRGVDLATFGDDYTKVSLKGAFQNCYWAHVPNISFKNVTNVQLMFSCNSALEPIPIRGNWDFSEIGSVSNSAIFENRKILSGSYIKLIRATSSATLPLAAAILEDVTVECKVVGPVSSPYNIIGSMGLFSTSSTGDAHIPVYSNFIFPDLKLLMIIEKDNRNYTLYAHVPLAAQIVTSNNSTSTGVSAVWLKDISTNIDSPIPIKGAVYNDYFTTARLMECVETWATQSTPKAVQLSEFQLALLSDLDKATITEKGYTIVTA